MAAAVQGESSSHAGTNHDLAPSSADASSAPTSVSKTRVRTIVGVLFSVLALLGLVGGIIVTRRRSQNLVNAGQTGRVYGKTNRSTAIPTTDFIRRNTAAAATAAPGSGGDVLYAVPSMDGGNAISGSTLHIDGAGYIVPHASLRKMSSSSGSGNGNGRLGHPGSQLDDGGYVADPSFYSSSVLAAPIPEYATIDENEGGDSETQEYQVPFECAEYGSAADAGAGPTVRVYSDATPAAYRGPDHGSAAAAYYAVIDGDGMGSSGQLDEGGYVADPSFYVSSGSSGGGALYAVPTDGPGYIAVAATAGGAGGAGGADSAWDGSTAPAIPPERKRTARLQSNAGRNSSSITTSRRQGGAPAVVVNPMYNGKGKPAAGAPPPPLPVVANSDSGSGRRGGAPAVVLNPMYNGKKGGDPSAKCSYPQKNCNSKQSLSPGALCHAHSCPGCGGPKRSVSQQCCTCMAAGANGAVDDSTI